MEETKVVPDRKKRQKYGGRTAGTQNKLTTDVKQMILEALHNAGGVQYLTSQASENPKAFLSLLGRVLPMQVTGEGGGALQITFTQTDSKL